MPKSLGAKKVSVQGCFPPHAMRIGKMMLDWGLYSDEPVTIKGIESTPFDIMFDLLLEVPETKQTPTWAYGLVLEVYGKVNGRQVKDTLWSEHPPQEEWGGSAAYYKNIAVPLSIGAQMITDGEVSARGVVPPESAYDPGRFFEELEKRGIVVHEKFEEL
jgi:saccharopine dehydrogenase-like NADP-dependent oxidoreductase